MIPSKIKIKNFAKRYHMGTLGGKGGKQICKFLFSLTLYLLNSFFHRFSRHSLRQALFVYRLIVATLIGNFFDDPF